MDKEIPSEGDRVQIIKNGNEKYSEGRVVDVIRFDDEKDDAVYMKIIHEPNNTGDDGFIEYKEGTWEGKHYSWLRKASQNTTNSKEVDRNCWEYKIISS